MRPVLLDTNILIRAQISPRSIPASLTQAVQSANVLVVSAISRAEICIKHIIGKLPLPSPEPEFWADALAELQAIPLSFTSEHAGLLATLPLIHRDPFDRMIAAQCLAEGLILATTDPVFERYGVQVMPTRLG